MFRIIDETSLRVCSLYPGMCIIFKGCPLILLFDICDVKVGHFEVIVDWNREQIASLNNFVLSTCPQDVLTLV